MGIGFIDVPASLARSATFIIEGFFLGEIALCEDGGEDSGFLASLEMTNRVSERLGANS